jgi:hypothetical protein
MNGMDHKRRSLAVLSAIFLALLTCLNARAQAWHEYTIPGYGHRFSIPGDFSRAGTEQGKLYFEEASGIAQIAAYRGELPPGTSISDIERLTASAEWIKDVTYRAGGESWFVLSGHQIGSSRSDADPTIFYFKAMTNAARTRYSAIEISYPRSRKLEFDPIVTRIEKSLTAPD